MTLCVYALTTGAPRLTATGIAGERLRSWGSGSVTAIVGELARVPRPSPGNLRRYDRVMRMLAARLPAILPARFGSCFDDAAELAFVIASRGPSLRRALANVRHRVQMTVRVITPPAHAAEADTHASPAMRPESRSGAAYLRARAAAVARERHVPGFEPVRAAVDRWVRDERVEKQGAVTTVYHLVPRASAAAYQRSLSKAAAAAGVQIHVSGPWPPYAFSGAW